MNKIKENQVIFTKVAARRQAILRLFDAQPISATSSYTFEWLDFSDKVETIYTLGIDPINPVSMKSEIFAANEANRTVKIWDDGEIQK